MPAISNFKGLVSDADFGDVPEGASQSQKNLSTTRPGALVPRQGIQPATFDSTQTISRGAFNTFQKMSFCKTRFGDLIGVNGVNRGFRWDGASAQADVLGIDAPPIGPIIEISAIQTVGTTDNEIDTIIALADPPPGGWPGGTYGDDIGKYRLQTTTDHGLLDGDRIRLGNIQITDDGAMPGQLNGKKFTIRKIDANELYLDKESTAVSAPLHDGTYDTDNKGTWSIGSSGETIAATDTVPEHQADDRFGEGATEGRYLCGYRYMDASSTPIYSSLSPEMIEVPDTFDTYRFSWTGIKQPLLANDPTRRVKKVELWRSTAGEENILYPVTTLDATHDGTDLTFEDDVKDDETLNATSVADQLYITDQGVIVARRQVLPPKDMAYVVMFQDRYFYFGIVKYNAGTVAIVGAEATATVTITDYTELNSGDKVNLIATDTTNYDFVNGSQSSVLGTWESATSNDQTATNLMNVINTDSGPSGSRFSATVDGAVVTITQASAGSAGNTTVTLTDAGTAGMSKANFTGGGGAGTVVTGTGTNWTSEMIGRYIEIDGEANANILITNIVGTTMTVDPPIERSSGSSLSYVITPEKSRRRQILFSYKDEPESVPETNSLTLQENANDDDEIVGAMPYGPYLYVLSQRHKYSVSYTTNPATDGSVRFLDDRGAFNHSCWDIFENTAYLMDDAGCYSFDGKESKTISGAIQDIWRRDSTGHRIDFSKQANFFVKVDRPKEKVYYFVSFVGDADLLPTRALVFNIRRQTFDPMHYPMQIAGASMIEKDGETRLVFGAENEKVHLVDEGTTDLIAAEVVATATGVSQTDSNLKAPSSTFVSGHVGTSVYIFEGTGKGQRRTIHTFTSGTEIGVRVDWDTRPDATSKFVVGAVEWNWKSSSFPIVASDDRTPRSIELKFKPTATAQSADVRMFYNGSTTVMTNETAVNEGDAVEIRETNKSDVVFHMKSDRSILSDSTGRETYRFSSANSIAGQGDHSLAIELRGYAGDEAQEIQEISIDGVGSVGGEEE